MKSIFLSSFTEMNTLFFLSRNSKALLQVENEHQSFMSRKPHQNKKKPVAKINAI